MESLDGGSWQCLHTSAEQAEDEDSLVVLRSQRSENHEVDLSHCIRRLSAESQPDQMHVEQVCAASAREPQSSKSKHSGQVALQIVEGQDAQGLSARSEDAGSFLEGSVKL